MSNKILDAKLAYLNDFAKSVNASQAKGKGSVIILRPGERPEFEPIHTGSPSLDARLGGGIPRGSMVEFFGPESAGKSTLAYQTIAELHRRNPEAIAVLMDFEGSYDEHRAARMGVDNDRILPIEALEGAEEAFETLRKLLEEGPRTEDGRGIIDLVVVDSVAAMVPQSEFEGEVGDQSVGLLARLMSRMLRMLTLSAKKSKTTFIWINQVREKVGVMYGNPETTPGGRALKHAAVIRIRAGRGGKVTGDEDAIIARMKVDKNKVSGIKGTTDLKITPAFGIDFGDDVATFGQKIGMVERKGSIYELTGVEGVELKEQGKEKFASAVNTLDNESRTKVYNALLEKALADPSAEVAVDQDEAASVDPAEMTEEESAA